MPALATASWRAPGRPAHRPLRYGPRRSAGAARRSARTGSARRACRGRSRAARGRSRRRAAQSVTSCSTSSISHSSSGGHRDQVLGQHVEGVLRDHRLLDLARAHPAGDHGALEQVGPELREDPPLGDLAQRVPGATDPLQPAGDGLRRLDLDHQVHGAHVDAELQRGGGHQAGQLARLEQLLDQARSSWESDPWWARAISGRRLLSPFLVLPACSVAGSSGLQLVVVHLVQALGDPLGAAAVVDEDDRRVVLADQPQQLRVDRGPDRAGVRGRVERRLDRARVDPLGGVLQLRSGAASCRCRRRRGACSTAGWARPCPRRGRRSPGRAAWARRHPRSRTPARCRRGSRRSAPAAAGSPRDRSSGCGLRPQVVEPLQRQRQVRAALRRCDRVDLVDDHRLDARRGSRAPAS